MPRIEALLGTTLDKVGAEHLRRLIDARVVEDEDIDFKSAVHVEGESFAADLVAMANTRGGVLVLGMKEDGGAASELAPLPLSDETTNRLRQWAAQWVAPLVSFDVRAVPIECDPRTGFYLVVIPRSPGAPHAVWRGDRLRYYRRDGGRNRPITESEVAAAYRDRFRQAESQTDRLARVREAGMASLQATTSVWLVLSAVPEVPGRMEVSAKRLRELEEWLGKFEDHFGDTPFARFGHGRPTVGVGRVEFFTSLSNTGDRPSIAYAQLYSDGASFLAVEVPAKSDDPGELIAQQGVLGASGLANLAVAHAVENAGVGGEGAASCDVVLGKDVKSVRLGFLYHSIWRQCDRTRSIETTTNSPIRSLSLSAIHSDPVERLAAARLLLTDLWHAFGLPEVKHITAEGYLNKRYLGQATIDRWKSVSAVPVIEDE